LTITIYDLSDKLPSNVDIVVAIDVFRAFSTSCYIAVQMPKRYIVVETLQEALELKLKFSDTVLIGERNGRTPEGFHSNNSPTEVSGLCLKDKTCIHTTSAGTRGLLKPHHQCQVITGSFVNCSSVTKYLTCGSFRHVALLCTTDEDQAIEDHRFAHFLNSRLNGQEESFHETIKAIQEDSGKGILAGTYAPATDFRYCMALDSFSFILRRKEVIDQEWKHELEMVNV